MRRSKKNLTLKVFLVSLFVITLNFYSYSLIYDNGAGGGYGSGGEGEDKGDTIESYIIEGAGYFLNGYSDVLMLLNRVEISGINRINYDEVLNIIDRALNNVKDAKTSFSRIIDLAESTPYNESVIAKLLSFDYNSFMVKNSLNSFVFKDVESFLENGNITGMFKRNYSDMSRIEEILVSIKEKLSLNKMPELSYFWNLNQQYMLAILLGQYAAQVFKEIL